MMFTTVEDAIQAIEARRNQHHGLKHFKACLQQLSNPQEDLHCIHIAGTNGKGSTTNYLRAMLQNANYRVGTFTSPYLITHLDRIRINDQYMEEAIFLDFVNTYYDKFVEWDLGMFETDMILACLYFKLKKVDLVLFEVGLGGRLDSTNVIHPYASVITNIGLDHTAILGDTYAQIAFEKAGIIKDGIPLFTAETRPVCLQVFEEQVQTHHTQMHPLETIEVCSEAPIIFRYQNVEYQLATSALYQIKNAALALMVITYLKQQGIIHITREQMQAALAHTQWLGRYEIVQEHPRIIIDGAHNPAGIQALCESIKKEGEVAILFSALKDKNFEDMIDLLTQVSKDITITHFENARSFDLSTLRKREGVAIIEDYQEALSMMLQKKKTIIITGSLYFISEIRRYFKK